MCHTNLHIQGTVIGNSMLKDHGIEGVVREIDYRTYTQDFFNTTITVPYLMMRGACLPNCILMELADQLAGNHQSFLLWDAVRLDQLLLNHRVWLMWVGIYMTLRKPVVEAVTKTGNTYANLMNHASKIFYSLSDTHSHGDHKTYQEVIDQQKIFLDEMTESVFCRIAEVLTKGVELPAYYT